MVEYEVKRASANGLLASAEMNVSVNRVLIFAHSAADDTPSIETYLSKMPARATHKYSGVV